MSRETRGTRTRTHPVVDARCVLQRDYDGRVGEGDESLLGHVQGNAVQLKLVCRHEGTGHTRQQSDQRQQRQRKDAVELAHS